MFHRACLTEFPACARVVSSFSTAASRLHEGTADLARQAGLPRKSSFCTQTLQLSLRQIARWSDSRSVRAQCTAVVPRLWPPRGLAIGKDPPPPAAVAIRAAVILPILLANIATAPVASAPEPCDVLRRGVVPPFVAIRAAVALACQRSSGVPVRRRCHVWQARTSLDASRAHVMLGLLSQTAT